MGGSTPLLGVNELHTAHSSNISEGKRDKYDISKEMEKTMDVICEICGRTFEAKTTRARYCPRCQKISAKITRAKWEEKTGFKAKRNAKRNADRAAERARQAEQFTRQHDEKVQEREQQSSDYEHQRRQTLTMKAETGDTFAMMHLALMDGDMLHYWRYRSMLIQAEDEKFGHVSNNTVGGISASDPSFAELVMYDMLNESEVKNNG